MQTLLRQFISAMETFIKALKVLLEKEVAEQSKSGPCTSVPPAVTEEPVAEEAGTDSLGLRARTCEVGMWYCEPRQGFFHTDAKGFANDVRRLRAGGVTVGQSWDAGEIYADVHNYPSRDWSQYQGRGWAGYIDWLAKQNAITDFEYPRLSMILFKPIWGAVASRKRSPADIGRMCDSYLKHLPDTQVGLNITHGVCLGDDFAKYRQTGLFTETVKAIGDSLGPTRFYMSNQLFDPALYRNSRPGTQMAALRRWIKPIAKGHHTFVYLPQYYPWIGNDWRIQQPKRWDEWLKLGLEECVAQQKFFPGQLEIQPILQASAWQVNRGPSHKEMHKQIRVSLDAGCEGIWLIGWHNPSFPGFESHWDSRSHFAEGRHYDEAIVREVTDTKCTVSG